MVLGKKRAQLSLGMIFFFFITWNQIKSFCQLLQEIFNFLLRHFRDLFLLQFVNGKQDICIPHPGYLLDFCSLKTISSIILLNEHYKNKNNVRNCHVNSLQFTVKSGLSQEFV